MNNDLWHISSLNTCEFKEMVEEIRSYILTNSGFDFELIVGTDSQYHYEERSTKYVTVVVIRRVGRGGKYFYRKEYKGELPSLRKKIWTEALLTYDIIEKLKIYLGDLISEEKMISHVDVGNNGKSKKYINEIKSIFISSGYDVKIKPDSYVASGIADKHSK
jgi:predicted RNase H-related nuclease YkuK (DUF458 family)